MDTPPGFRRYFPIGCGALLVVAGAIHEFLVPVPGRDAFLAVLVEAAASGREIAEVARARNWTEHGWSRGATRHAADPELAAELTRRLELILGRPDSSSGTTRAVSP